MANEFLIGDILTRIKRPVTVADNQIYKLVTIKMNHKGVVLREAKLGGLIKSGMYQVRAGDFILSGIDARNGAFGIVPKGLDGAIVTNDFWYFEINDEIISKELFLELTATTWFDEICKRGSDGTTQRIRLQKDKFFNQPILLPGMAEQKELLSKLHLIKEKQASLTGEVQTQKSLLSQLKQSILQEAIQGKLTEEWREKRLAQGEKIESASELLKRIQVEKARLIKEKKIKKEKPLPPITEAEKPFELPVGWEWCRLGEVANDVSYGTSQKSVEINVGVPVLRMGNITSSGEIIYGNLKYVQKTIKDLPGLYLKNCDLVFNRTNSFELVGKCGVFNNSEAFTLASYLIRIRFFEGVSSGFIRDYINSTICRKTQIEPYVVQQNGQANFNGSKLKLIIVPIAPSDEQKAIVEKVGSLMEKCRTLEEEITQSEQHSKMLMQAVLKEAFEN